MGKYVQTLAKFSRNFMWFSIYVSCLVTVLRKEDQLCSYPAIKIYPSLTFQ